MSYRVEGDYFEACGCDVSCDCIYLAPATREHCDVFFAWNIHRGRSDGVNLAGLRAALGVHSPKRMTDGGWRVELFVDDRADPEQAKALAAIFSGSAGGHLAKVVPLIGEVAAVHSAAISFAVEGRKRRLRVGEALEMDAEELTGGDGKSAIVISNALLGAVTQPLRQGRAGTIRYAGAWSFEATGTNAFITDFAYEA
jgi:hypothetical protein